MKSATLAGPSADPFRRRRRMLADTDPDVRESAARQWCAWEDAHVSLAPGHRPNPRFGEDQLILNAARLGAIPGVLIHGRFDVSGPLDTAWRLHQHWPGSELQVIDDMGHGGGDSFTTLVTTSVSILGVGPRGESRNATGATDHPSASRILVRSAVARVELGW